MISNKDKLITQLMSCITLDLKDKSILRIDIDNTLRYLSMFSYNLPYKKFEKALDELLNTRLKGSKLTQGTKYSIASVIIDLANMLHVTDEQIIAYYEQHPTEAIDPAQVKDWRKKYYGSMDKNEKKHLIEAMQGKLRPEVIEEIKRS